MYKLKYDKVPTEWINGLPIGNGRLAAMYWGDEKKEILSLNHEYLWRGKYKDREAEYSADKLPVLRELLKKRDYFRAGIYANLFFGGFGGDCSVKPGRIDSYQPAGDVVFERMNKNGGEKTVLDTENASVETKRESGEESAFFCDSRGGNVLARIKSATPENLKIFVRREYDSEAKYAFEYFDDGFSFECEFICGIKYRIEAKIKTDGKTERRSDAIFIKEATQTVCAVNILLCEEDKREFNLDFEKVFESHREKFSSYMKRMTFEIDAEESTLSTDVRIREIKSGKRDIKMQELYFHYGRYLMISSCIAGKLPPNLQGKWNGELNPPWKSDYHFDINMEMNEWMIEGANLSEFADGLTDFLRSFLESGKKAAKNLYGCRGIMMGLASDVWGKCSPESFGYGVWIGAAAWLSQALWKHYIYTGDKEYLKEKAYEFFKETALFYEDFLCEDENGVMQIMPSQSPENRFEEAGNLVTVGICISSANEVQLAYDALGYAIKTARILGVDEENAKKWEELRKKLPAFKIGSDGRLMEWNEEFTEEQPGHKHLSHLYGLYPSEIFTPEKRKAEYEAAVKSFRYRISHESGYTGWSRAWIAGICARIGDSEEFYKQIEGLLRDFATESLLDIHPDPLKPGIEPDIFQIDGNFGMVAAVTEALCGYFDNKAHFLRALPKEWKCGKIGGLKLPGGHCVSFEWKECRVTKAEITMGFEKKLNAVINGKETVIEGKENERIEMVF